MRKPGKSKSELEPGERRAKGLFREFALKLIADGVNLDEIDKGICVFKMVKEPPR